mgnify:FL=1|tara:strand:+ start:3995 stop:4429 length:435 start_codon:yes stop_codon:yes gene_type:complete
MQNLINKENKKKIDLIKVVSLLIHAAKIDEKYTEKEKKLIKEFILKFSNNSNENVTENNILDILNKAEDFEKNSNQILEFTKEVKKVDLKLKKFVLQTLWQIVLSDNKAGIYESNLMRRICGLLYIPDKLSGEIKSNILDTIKK